MTVRRTLLWIVITILLSCLDGLPLRLSPWPATSPDPARAAGAMWESQCVSRRRMRRCRR